ncbi:5-methylcytosine-specific restriction endonuclease McrA [Herbaspirillum sp. Sphag1AN]|uniref:HNH endonuclease n=1 Tax=unclassified Herbaspirillum TaxID=2624150 RepID=UPI00161938E8|nr:5-methylcytosine-specific restriction endonuclease McrA [Herbaspirillum sp. Sphag1AN]MBB3245448.1 5-methylcytosine-specific restriction endonuclease McrA [Herbaspirillum sp. Sphag64]
MNTKKCQLCRDELNHSNDSKEHIIPNAIGGKKKVSGFICKSCNNKAGETWDAELASQLNWFSLFFWNCQRTWNSAFHDGRNEYWETHSSL